MKEGAQCCWIWWGKKVHRVYEFDGGQSIHPSIQINLDVLPMNDGLGDEQLGTSYLNKFLRIEMWKIIYKLLKVSKHVTKNRYCGRWEPSWSLLASKEFKKRKIFLIWKISVGLLITFSVWMYECMYVCMKRSPLWRCLLRRRCHSAKGRGVQTGTPIFPIPWASCPRHTRCPLRYYRRNGFCGQLCSRH